MGYKGTRIVRLQKQKQKLEEFLRFLVEFRSRFSYVFNINILQDLNKIQKYQQNYNGISSISIGNNNYNMNTIKNYIGQLNHEKLKDMINYVKNARKNVGRDKIYARQFKCLENLDVFLDRKFKCIILLVRNFFKEFCFLQEEFQDGIYVNFLRCQFEIQEHIMNIIPLQQEIQKNLEGQIAQGVFDAAQKFKKSQDLQASKNVRRYGESLEQVEMILNNGGFKVFLQFLKCCYFNLLKICSNFDNISKIHLENAEFYQGSDKKFVSFLQNVEGSLQAGKGQGVVIILKNVV